MTTTRKRMAVELVMAVVAAGVLVVAPPGGPALAQAAPDRADGVEVYERDVFVIVGSTLRHPDAGTAADASLFNEAGVALESSPGDFLTWGDWTAASADSKASVSVSTTTAKLKLSGLVPNGTYSVFWGTIGPDSEQPLCPGVERTLPLDATKESRTGKAPNAFVADANGKAKFEGAVNQNLFEANQVFFTVVWQAFGGTSYPFPNRGELLTQGPDCRSSFGQDAMRHLLVLQKW